VVSRVGTHEVSLHKAAGNITTVHKDVGPGLTVDVSVAINTGATQGPSGATAAGSSGSIEKCTKKHLAGLEGYLIDLDGTMYEPGRLLPGAQEFYSWLRYEQGVRIRHQLPGKGPRGCPS